MLSQKIKETNHSKSTPTTIFQVFFFSNAKFNLRQSSNRHSNSRLMIRQTRTGNTSENFKSLLSLTVELDCGKTRKTIVKKTTSQ